MKTLLNLLSFLIVLTVYSQNNELFNQANALYTKGMYEEAISKYEQIIKSDTHNAAVYFNLANAHYKLNHVAPSIFYYEKALQLTPNDTDVINNLYFAQNMTIDAIENVPEIGISKLYKNLVQMFSTTKWAIFSVIGIFIFVVLFLLYHFTEVSIKKRGAFIISILGLFVAGFSLYMAFEKNALDMKSNPAIIFDNKVNLNTDPTNDSAILYTLHEGTKVEVIETYGKWHKIKLANHTEGWMPTSSIKILKKHTLVNTQ